VLAELAEHGELPQVYGEADRRADASALMIPLFGLLGRHDRRAHAIVDAALHDLSAGSYVYRYEPDGADGFIPGESAFVPVCWWAVSALARLGRVDEARARLDELCRELPRLLAEEFDPVNGESLGNVPLVWSHTELARALYIVDAAVRRRRWTPVGLLAWRLARYARLRWFRR
jgi:GH15 family glucan-1,4-alpha-glucosidase